MSNMFSDCGLTTLDLSKFDTSNVLFICAGAFDGLNKEKEKSAERRRRLQSDFGQNEG